MGLFFKKKSPESVFWAELKKIESKLTDPNQDLYELIQELNKKVKDYNSGLVTEISVLKDGKRNVVISADGISDMFPVVETLVSAAPKFDNINVIAFRPRKPGFKNHGIKYRGIELNSGNVSFIAAKRDGCFDLALFHPEYEGENKEAAIGASYILLDAMLGEYDVVKGIRYIDFRVSPPEGIGQPHEITNLPLILDKVKPELNAYK